MNVRAIRLAIWTPFRTAAGNEKAEHGRLYGVGHNAALGTDGLLSNMHNFPTSKDW